MQPSKVVGRIQFPTAGGLRSCFLADCQPSHSLPLGASCFPSHVVSFIFKPAMVCRVLLDPCLLLPSSLPLPREHSLLLWACVTTLTHLGDLPFLKSTLPHNITWYDILSRSQVLASGCGILGAVPRNPAYYTNHWCDNRWNEPPKAIWEGVSFLGRENQVSPVSISWQSGSHLPCHKTPFKCSLGLWSSRKFCCSLSNFKKGEWPVGGFFFFLDPLLTCSFHAKLSALILTLLLLRESSA